MDFDTWLAKVNDVLERLCFMGVDDLPDQCYSDMYEDEMTPEEAAEEVLDNEGMLW